VTVGRCAGAAAESGVVVVVVVVGQCLSDAPDARAAPSGVEPAAAAAWPD